MKNDKDKLKAWKRASDRQKRRYWAILESVHREQQQFRYYEEHRIDEEPSSLEESSDSDDNQDPRKGLNKAPVEEDKYENHLASSELAGRDRQDESSGSPSELHFKSKFYLDHKKRRRSKNQKLKLGMHLLFNLNLYRKKSGGK